MYQSTTAFGTLVQQDSRTFKCLLTYGETSITTVRSIKFTGGSEGEDDFSLGSTMSQYIEVTIPGKGLVVEGTEMLLQIGMDVNGKTEYIPMGYFTAGKSQKTDDQITFTAYDRMMNTERTFSMNGTTTNTVAVLKKIAEITGVPIVTTGLTAISMKVPKGYSCREVLSYVAQLYGAFAVCNRIGQIELHTYVDSAYKIGAGRYWGNFEHNDYAFNVTRMVCATGEKPTNGVEQSLAYRTTAEDAYTLASGLKKDVDISSEFVKTYNDWAFKWKAATMVDGAEVGTYQKYITLESGNILLGHSNSKNKLKITNDSIQFKGTSDTAITPDSDATAWITGKVFHIDSGEIESSLKFGKILMKPTKNGIQIGNKAEFGERVRIGFQVSSNSQFIYSDCPLVVGSNSVPNGNYPFFAVDDGYAFISKGIITPGDFIIKFGEYTLNRPDGGMFNGTLRPYYRADDVINMEFYVTGYVTSNKQEVIFFIPFSRPIMSTKVSISSIKGLTIRQNGIYIYGSTASKPIKPSSYTATVIGGRNGLNVRAKIPMGSSEGFTDNEISKIVNNDTCAITASIKIDF